MFRTLILLCAFSAVFGALPNGWKACSMKDKKYSECLATEILKAVKSVKNGDKKLGVLSLDPLKITELTLKKGSGPVAMELQMQNLHIHGITDGKILGIKNNWKTMQIESLTPKLIILSNYKVDGKVLVLPITGQGKANLTWDQLNIKADVKWKKIEKNGIEYINVESLTISLVPKKLHMDLQNLFSENGALAKNTNTFLNENWDIILDELRKPISDALSIVLINFANQVLNKIPFSDINK